MDCLFWVLPERQRKDVCSLSQTFCAEQNTKQNNIFFVANKYWKIGQHIYCTGTELTIAITEENLIHNGTQESIRFENPWIGERVDELQKQALNLYLRLLFFLQVIVTIIRSWYFRWSHLCAFHKQTNPDWLRPICYTFRESKQENAMQVWKNCNILSSSARAINLSTDMTFYQYCWQWN